MVPRIFLVTAGSSWGLLDFPPLLLLRVYILRADSFTFRYESATPWRAGSLNERPFAQLPYLLCLGDFIMKLLGVRLGNEGGWRRGAFLFGGFRIEWIAFFSAHPTTKIEPFGAHLVPR